MDQNISLSNLEKKYYKLLTEKFPEYEILLFRHWKISVKTEDGLLIQIMRGNYVSGLWKNHPEIVGFCVEIIQTMRERIERELLLNFQMNFHGIELLKIEPGMITVGFEGKNYRINKDMPSGNDFIVLPNSLINWCHETIRKNTGRMYCFEFAKLFGDCAILLCINSAGAKFMLNGSLYYVYRENMNDNSPIMQFHSKPRKVILIDGDDQSDHPSYEAIIAWCLDNFLNVRFGLQEIYDVVTDVDGKPEELRIGKYGNFYFKSSIVIHQNGINEMKNIFDHLKLQENFKELLPVIKWCQEKTEIQHVKRVYPDTISLVFDYGLEKFTVKGEVIREMETEYVAFSGDFFTTDFKMHIKFFSPERYVPDWGFENFKKVFYKISDFLGYYNEIIFE